MVPDGVTTGPVAPFGVVVVPAAAPPDEAVPCALLPANALVPVELPFCEAAALPIVRSIGAVAGRLLAAPGFVSTSFSPDFSLGFGAGVATAIGFNATFALAALA